MAVMGCDFWCSSIIDIMLLYHYLVASCVKELYNYVGSVLLAIASMRGARTRPNQKHKRLVAKLYSQGEKSSSSSSSGSEADSEASGSSGVEAARAGLLRALPARWEGGPSSPLLFAAVFLFATGFPAGLLAAFACRVDGAHQASSATDSNVRLLTLSGRNCTAQ